MKPVLVQSSNITALGYAEGDLFVRFAKTGVYKYKAVPPEVVLAVTFADSVGGQLNALVKSKGYAFEKVASPFDDEVVEVAA